MRLDERWKKMWMEEDVDGRWKRCFWMENDVWITTIDCRFDTSRINHFPSFVYFKACATRCWTRPTPTLTRTSSFVRFVTLASTDPRDTDSAVEPEL
jgi:hypothetical protein